MRGVSTQDLILHHYEMSPFSEKVRKVFAFKSLTWFAVEQPNMAPKPNLTPLTGGYRRIPVLQIGADIFCDTKLIVAEIERRFANPSLYPKGHSGVVDIVADWADHRLFSMSAGPTVVELIDALPEGFMEDRAAMTDGFSPDAMAQALPILRQQLLHSCQRLERQLVQTPYLLGESFSLADAASYHVINFASFAPSFAMALQSFPAILEWLDRIRAMGVGDMKPLDPADALSLARDTEPEMAPPADALETVGDLAIGQTVAVCADDYGKEVTTGKILWLRHDEVALLREDADLGSLIVHFPLAGYRIGAA